MAIFIRTSNNFIPTKCIRIIDSQMTDDHTEYKIEVSLGDFKWTVVKRYSQFYDLHERILKEFPLMDKDMLPKKKLFGNFSKDFVAKRRNSLEVYLQSLLRSLTHLPSILITFLSFHKYEVHGLTEGLADELYTRGEALLASNKFTTLSTLQMFAIGTRLVLPEPTCISKDVRKDMGHLVEFVCKLKHLQIIGQPLSYSTSNIIPNDLEFGLQHFKSLQTLKLVSCRLSSITIDNHVKKSVKKLIITKSLLQIKHVLMSGLWWDDCSQLSEPIIEQNSWSSLETAIFRSNQITQIDDSIKLLPNIKKLILSDNRLSNIDNLIHLSFLYHLDLSLNHFSSVQSFHANLGNISHLNLSHNDISSLKGFSRLYSLVDINLSHNKVGELSEVDYLSQLPFVQVLDLRHNPVTTALDYRLCVLAKFTERFTELTLDGVKTRGKEVELVLVRQVILRRNPLEQTTPNNNTAINSTNNKASNNTKTINNTNKDNNTNNTKNNLLSSKDCQSEENKKKTRSTKDLKQKSKNSIALKVENAEVITDRENSKCSSETTSDNKQKLSQKHSSTSTQPTTPKISYANNNVPNKLGHQDDSVQKRSHSSKSRKKYFILPETLPNHTDQSLLTNIQSLMASVVLRGGLKKFDLKQEIPCCVAWCGVVLSQSRFHQADADVPSCVCLTPHSIHLLRVDALRGDAGIPKIRHLTSISFSDVQCFLLGAKKTYFRVLLKDTPSVFLVFVTFTASKTEYFLSEIKKAFRRSVPELDEYVDPLVFDVGAGCEEHIICNIAKFHSKPQPYFQQQQHNDNNGNDPNKNVFINNNHPSNYSTHVVFMQLVQPIRDDYEYACTHALVATTTNLYVIKHDFTYAPAISVDVMPIEVNNVHQNSTETLSVFPIASKIVSMQIYDGDCLDHKLATYLSAASSSLNSHQFIGYGLRITFNLGLSGIQTLDLRWPTSHLRGVFLTWFVETRNELKSSSSSSSLHANSKKSYIKTKLKKMSSDDKHPSESEQIIAQNLSDNELNFLHDSHDISNDRCHSSFSKDIIYPSKSQESPLVSTPPSTTHHLSSSSDSESVAFSGTPLSNKISNSNCSHHSTLKNNNLTPSTNTSENEASHDLRTLSPLNSPSDTNDNSGPDDLAKSFTNEAGQGFEYEQIPEFDVIPIISTRTGSAEEKQVENVKVQLRISPQTIPIPDLSNCLLDFPIATNPLAIEINKHVSNKSFSTNSTTPTTVTPSIYKHLTPEFLSTFNKDSFDLFPSLRDLATDLPKLDLFMARHVMNGKQHESLRHLCIASISFYNNPLVQIPACLLLTNLSIHFFSNFDTSCLDYSHIYSHTRPHCICLVNDDNHDISISLNNFNKPLLTRVASISLRELHEVDLGMFGQFIRFVVHDDLTRVISCATRDSTVTQTLMQHLLKCLSTEHPPNMLASHDDDDEVYKGESKDDDFVYNHVHFMYPSHELLADLSFVVSFATQLDDPQINNTNTFKKVKFLNYISCFVLEDNKHCTRAYIPLRSECLVMTKDKLTFVIENQTNFPTPQFVVFPPDLKQFEFKRCFKVEDLLEVVCYDEDPRILKVVFKNHNPDEYEEDEMEVDTTFNHFDGQVKECVKRMKKEHQVIIHITNPRDVISLVHMLKELNNNTLATILPSFDFC